MEVVRLLFYTGLVAYIVFVGLPDLFAAWSLETQMIEEPKEPLVA
jgi:hypothetical protein